jgi:hypothetical protein
MAGPLSRGDTWRVRRIGRWVRREPWMAFTAFVATVCAMTIVAIRWLAVLGIVRDYAITRTSGSVSPVGGGWSSNSSSYHRQLGLISGPSTALTQYDFWAWRLGFLAGILWMLRLGVRSADRRVGVLRGVGVAAGFGVFVVTGVAHRIADVVVQRERTRALMDLLITLWCFAAVLAAVFVTATVSAGAVSYGVPTLGDHAVLAPAGWSIARNALQLVVVLGGWSIALFLTRSWLTLDEPADAKRRQPVSVHDAIAEPSGADPVGAVDDLDR